jgi:ribosomal protein S21
VSGQTVKTLQDARRVTGLVPSRKPAHAVVAVTPEFGVERALKQVQKLMQFSGAWLDIQRAEGGYVGPSEKRRKKSLTSRKRQRKATLRQENAIARKEVAVY